MSSPRTSPRRLRDPLARARRGLGRLVPVGRRRTPEDLTLDREVRAILAGRESGARIAVVAVTGRSRTDALSRRVRRTARVERWDATLPAARLHVRLAGSGRFDLIVVDAPVRRWPRLLEQVVFHLDPGGAIVFRGEPGRAKRPLLRRLRALDRIRSGEADPQAEGRKADDLRALARAVSDWHVAGPHVVVGGGGSALAKLSPADVDTLLPGPGLPRGRLVAQVPAARFTARCQVTQSASDLRHLEVREIEAPPASLREYHDVLCLPGQIVVQDSVVLPDTFRHVHRRRLRSAAVDDLAPGFVGLRTAVVEPVRRLSGTYVHLDSEYQGHYGHLVTEQLSRMWAWPRILELTPRPRVLLSTRTPRTTLHAHERDLLAAFGVAESDVVLFDEPVRVERLLSADPMFSQPAFVHPALAETWRHAGDALAEAAPLRPRPRRIFCARRSEKRGCRNAAEVEDLFVRQGFTIVHPEEHPLAEQAAMFQSADVIAGYAGAAMFNLCYTTTAKDVVMLVSDSYTAQNEYLMAAVQGHRLTLVWCRADVPQPATGFSAEAYQSSYACDLDRDGPWLQARLDDLGGLETMAVTRG